MGKMNEASLGQYPSAAGFKEIGGTSQQAASMISASALRDKCIVALKANGPMTADEVAHFVGRSILSIRPRMSELKELGLVKKTAERRRNASGVAAVVWKAVDNV